jgi:hypothetical protein
MRTLLPAGGKLPNFFNTVVSFSIPGAPTRRVSRYVYPAR